MVRNNIASNTVHAQGNVRNNPPGCTADTKKTLKIISICLIAYAVVILTYILLHYLMPDDVYFHPKHTVFTNQTAPLGTIVAWVPSPNVEHREDVPFGWQLCDGQEITEPTSPWLGQNTPNLTDRFLRGGGMTNFLTFQDDQLQDHVHEDGGHTHVDAGHTHTDSGHTHTDKGHIHSYQDAALRDRGNVCEGRYWDQRDATRATDTGHADIQVSHAQITTSTAKLSTSVSNIGAVKPGTKSARPGDETRPKAVLILWIIKIVE